jgi:hypothetical protein
MDYPQIVDRAVFNHCRGCFQFRLKKNLTFERFFAVYIYLQEVIKLYAHEAASRAMCRGDAGRERANGPIIEKHH